MNNNNNNLNIQVIYDQCLSLIFIKLKPQNFYYDETKSPPLVHDIGILYHLLNGKKPTKEIKDGERSKSLIPQYQL